MRFKNIDADTIIENLMFGLATRNYGPMPTELFAYKPEIEQYGYHFDLDKAKSLIAEAGWADTDGDGILEKDGAKIEIIFWGPSDPTSTKVCQVLQNQLEQAGFKVDLQLLEVGTFLARLPENVHDIEYNGWGQTEPDMLRGMTNGVANVGLYRDERYQTLVTQALETTDRAERTELYFQASQKILADAAIVPLWSPWNILVARNHVKGLKWSQQDEVAYEDLYLEQ